MQFWDKKLDKNLQRDRRVQRELQAKGWRTLVVWECQTREEGALSAQIREFFAAASAHEEADTHR